MSLRGRTVLPHHPASRALKQRLFDLLLSCDGGDLRSAAQVHAQIIVNGLAGKNFLLAKLLSFYAASGCLSSAQRLLDNIAAPSTAVYNQLIRGHAHEGSHTPHGSVQVYRRMVAAGAVPDEYTYSYLLTACVPSGGSFRVWEQIHGSVIRTGFRSNVCVRTILVRLYALKGGIFGMASARKLFDEMGETNVMLWNTLLSGYIHCGDFDTASSIFHKMPEKNVVSWTVVIAGYAKNGNCRKALSLFCKMQMAGVEPDQVVLIAVLSACAELGDLKMGKWIHLFVLENICHKDQPVSVSLNNAIIHMYASCGLIERAYEVFRIMPQRNTVSWTTMITGFAKQGLAWEAVGIFDLMLSLGEQDEKPDELTFLGVLVACSHGGLVDKGRNVFKSMESDWEVLPRMEHYGSMVDLLSRAGHLDEACKLIQSMPMKPNDVVWGALLSGCRIYKNPELASLVAQKLLHELNPGLAAGYLSMLSDVYAEAKRWKEVADTRQKMSEIGAKKPAGRSWVQVEGILHDFMADDWTHKHSSSIYDALGVLTEQSKQEGEHQDFLDMFAAAG